MIPWSLYEHSSCTWSGLWDVGGGMWQEKPDVSCSHDIGLGWLVLCNRQSVSSIAQSCPTLCDPMDCSTLGFPVHHQLLELTQIHVHWVGDAVQPSHPLSSPSPPTFNLSQHQGLFTWVSSLHQVAKVLEFHLQHQFFQWIFRTDFLLDGLLLLVVAKQLFLFCLNCMSSLQLKQKLHLLSNVLFPSSPYFN